MTLLQSILLGIIQGLTEFLPISSSAHLVLTPYLLGWKIPAQEAFIFNVLVQLGTLLSVILYFRADLVRIVRAFVVAIWRRQPFADPDARLGWYLILATIPAGLAGVVIKKQVEAAFSDPVATALLLLVTAALLVIAERIGKRARNLHQLNWKDALWIGIAQAIAIFPGVSRSGSTIAGGMTRNFERVSSGRFAFLMAVPVMLAAGLLETIDLVKVPNLSSFLPILLAGFLTSAVVGYFSIRWLLRFLTQRPLYIFAIYCVLLCITVLVYT
ncbi:MAG: undecaprenyl-diphosphatase UppP, partial [Anaerolineaceae bacterium]|nr:undecaprenyl-diphosphatase UppP [Anaerolineaceae bacterium]